MQAWIPFWNRLEWIVLSRPTFCSALECTEGFDMQLDNDDMLVLPPRSRHKSRP